MQNWSLKIVANFEIRKFANILKYLKQYCIYQGLPVIVIVPAYLSDWGSPGSGCRKYGDNSDISMKMRPQDSSSPPSCGNIYIDPVGDQYNFPMFSCKRSQTCIHIDNRCDLHPHPDCLYEGIAEDEEDCIDEYKRKNLIQRSAIFKCPSAIHNSETLPIKATVYDSIKNDFEDVTILAAGITVQIMATICDGIPECFNRVDELFCGFTKQVTILIGKYHIVIMNFEIIYKYNLFIQVYYIHTNDFTFLIFFSYFIPYNPYCWYVASEGWLIQGYLAHCE